MSQQELRSSPNAQQTIESERWIPVKEVVNNRFVFKNSDYSANEDWNEVSRIPAEGNVPTALSNQTISFKIDSTNVDMLHYPCLEVLLTNSTGANASRTSLHLEVNRVDVYNGENGDPIWNTTGQELHIATGFIPKNVWDCTYGLFGMTALYAQAGTVVADGATQELLLPLFGFFKACKLFLAGLANSLRVKISFYPSTYSILTGAEMSLTNINLVLYGRNLQPKSKLEALQKYRHAKIPMALSHLSIDRVEKTETLAASSRYSFTLNSGSAGVCAFMIMSIRLASTANAAATSTTYITADTLDIINSKNDSICGGYARRSAARQLQHASLFQNGSYIPITNAVYFASDPVGAYARGINSGHYLITGNEQVVITTLCRNGRWIIFD